MSTWIMCPECINKQEEICRLREELRQLKAKLQSQQRNITEGYFGAAIPSSKKAVKNNSHNNNENKNRGGAKIGHQGNGRRSLSLAQADRVEQVKLECNCPKCNGSDLESLDQHKRTVIDQEAKKVTLLYQ